MKPNERLSIAIEELGLDGKRLSEALGVSAATVSDWKSGKIPLKKPTALALQALYGLTPAWLLDGRGQMWSTPRDFEWGDSDIVSLPYFPGTALVGAEGELFEQRSDTPKIPFRESSAQEILKACGAGDMADLVIVECEGESMRPLILPGDQVLINTALSLREHPMKGHLYLVRRDPSSADARIKRIKEVTSERLVLTSDAPGYSLVELGLARVSVENLVLGRACWLSRMVLASELTGLNW